MGKSAIYLTDSSRKRARAVWAKEHRKRTVNIGDAVVKWNEAKKLTGVASDSALPLPLGLGLAMLLLDR